jgi:hypothetical protein
LSTIAATSTVCGVEAPGTADTGEADGDAPGAAAVAVEGVLASAE